MRLPEEAHATIMDRSLIVEARRLLVDMHYRSRIGHLGGNLSCIDSLIVLHFAAMGPDDRFILSKGHAAGAYYVTLALRGRIPIEELTSFHQDDTRLSGHPPASGIADIRFATGSLGHGLSLAAGLALAAKLRGATHRVFCLTSDGEWQEGATFEALIFAVHHRLDNLTVLVDHNRLQGFGSTAEVASMDPLDTRLRGFGIELRRCDGHDPDAILEALRQPNAAMPNMVLLDTIKGSGIASMEGRLDSHYLPPTEAQHAEAMRRWGAV